MSLFPAFLATRFPLKDFSWLAHFDPIGYPFYFSNAMKNACVIFFPPLPLSSVHLRRVHNFQEESSLLRLYTRFHTKSLISLIFSEKKNIYIFQQRDDKKRKKGKKERNFSKNLIEVNELFLYFAKDKNIH